MFDRHKKVWPGTAPHHLTLPETSLSFNLEVSATRYPHKNAIIFYDSTLTYGQLKQQVDTLAGFLAKDLGVAKGDRVLLYMQNSPQWIIAYYAILRANAVVIPVNPMNLTEELKHYANDTEATVALCGQELYPNLEPLLDSGLVTRAVVAAYSDYLTRETDLNLPEAVSAPRQEMSRDGVLLWSQVMDAGRTPPVLSVGPEDLCVFPYTSGTTGAPKGCMHTHRSVMATVVGAVSWTPATADSVTLATLPFFHVTGMQVSMNAPIYVGATIVLMTRWDRYTAGELIQRYGVTEWRNIVTMVIDFLSDPKARDYDLSTLRAIGGGGAAMPQAIEARLFEMTGLHYIEGYGLSETIAATHINPPDNPKAQCLGIPVFDVDCRIIDVASGQELGVGETGEIVTHGPQVFKGYWNRPDATREAFIEIDGKSFFRTGDLGYYDEEGYFFLVDRVKRMINASGYKVWPAEVESMMYKHPAIQEACVISTPDPRRGETVKAVVVLRADAGNDITEESVVAWCHENMAAYKAPRVVEFRDSLPRSGTGKLMWRLLQEEEKQKAGN
ncbi:long-chain fatty acid--CoA ligase [Mangrovitalea sediminis]|uniref:long-chain fatty acid--CoA ligase n=1 Tax=Mangrovitalea sediminis TaxID=1982043 RepID=UPI000BE4C78D|nr:long-chain fatty acid--CoA ligase [Mangrovitalea sediminis]